jgi:ComF family protein
LRGFCRYFLDSVFPRKCLHCGAQVGREPLCASCAALIERAGSPGRLPGPVRPEVISPFITGEPLLQVVRFLKFGGGTSAAGWMGRRMAAALMTHLDRREGALLVPVPLHWTRLVRRGFDQAVLLAKEISRAAGIPAAARILGRRRRTGAQSSLGRAGRRRNVAGAFFLRRGVLIRGRKIILVDDLVTTGETALACCEALSEGSPSAVTVLCAGRKDLE